MNPEKLFVEQITLEGIFGYRSPVTVSLTPGIWGVLGDNQTRDGMDSNGAGKSSFLDAICWVFTGYATKRRACLAIINAGYDHCSATLQIRGGEDVYRVTRELWRDANKPQKLTFKKNGVSIPEQRLAEIQAVLNRDLLGLEDAKDFFSFYYLTGDAVKTFLSSDADPADRYKVVSRFLKLDQWDAGKQRASKGASALKNQIAQKDAIIEMLKAQVTSGGAAAVESELLALADDEIENLSNFQSQEKICDEIEEQRKQIDEAIQVDKDYGAAEEWLKKVEADGEQALELLRREPSFDEYLVQRTKKEDGKQDLLCEANSVGKPKSMQLETQHDLMEEARHKSVTASAEWTRLSSVKCDSMLCPKCKAELMDVDSTLVVFDGGVHRTLVEVAFSLKERLFEEYAAEKTKYDSIKTELDNLRGATTSAVAVFDADIARLSSDMARVSGRVSVEEMMAKVTENVEAAKKKSSEVYSILAVSTEVVGCAVELFADRRTELSNKLIAAEIELSHDQDALRDTKQNVTILTERLANLKVTEDALKKSLDERKELDKQWLAYDYWVKGFARIKDRVVAQFLPTFEIEANRMLAQLGMIEEVKFSLEATTGVGSIVPKFEIKVFDGLHWRLANEYSSGEWGRIAVSIVLAFRRNMSYRLNGGMDLMLCDEIDRNFDLTGLDYLFRLLPTQTGQAFVISHRPVEEIGAFLEKLIVVRKTHTNTTISVA